MDVQINEINDRRLTIKLIGYLFLFSMVYTLVYSAINLKEEYDLEVEKVNNSFIQIEKTVLKQLAFSLWQMDDTQLKIQLDSTMKLKGVVFIEIIEKGKSLISVGKEQVSDFKELKFSLEYFSSDISSKLGLVRVQVTYSLIKDKLFDDILGIVINELFKFLILALLLLILVHKLIIKHLLKMADYAHNLDIDNLHKPLKLDKKYDQEKFDVLDNMSNAINQMRKKLVTDIEQMEVVQEKLSLSNKIMEKEIQDRIKVQEEIKLLNEQLEQKVFDRTKELEASNRELQVTFNNLTNTQDQLIHSEKMASLGGLVAGVAHEINTPVGMGLTGITHFLDISKKIKQLYIDDDMSEEEFEEYLNTSNDLANSINANLVRAADLIKSFKQVAVDQSSEAKRIFNLNVYIQEVLVSLRNFTKKTKINIVVECPTTIKINSYPGSFSQIITNLVMNSLHHGYNPGEKGIINIIMKLEGNSLMMKYTDDGKGIRKEDLPRIYDPFYTTNREDGGSGLGMNILYNIVTTSFNGKIECISAENEGVSFLIEMNDIEFIK